MARNLRQFTALGNGDTVNDKYVRMAVVRLEKRSRSSRGIPQLRDIRSTRELT